MKLKVHLSSIPKKYIISSEIRDIVEGDSEVKNSCFPPQPSPHKMIKKRLVLWNPSSPDPEKILYTSIIDRAKEMRAGGNGLGS